MLTIKAMVTSCCKTDKTGESDCPFWHIFTKVTYSRLTNASRFSIFVIWLSQRSRSVNVGTEHNPSIFFIRFCRKQRLCEYENTKSIKHSLTVFLGCYVLSFNYFIRRLFLNVCNLIQLFLPKQFKQAPSLLIERWGY